MAPFFSRGSADGLLGSKPAGTGVPESRRGSVCGQTRPCVRLSPLSVAADGLDEVESINR